MITMMNDGWQLRSEELFVGPEMQSQVCMRTDDWMDVSVPCDVHVPLIANGVIKEPLERDYYKDCRWIENKSWWFKKEFDVPELPDELSQIDIVLEALDSESDIFLNGIHIAHHRSAFYPFRLNTADILVKGKNVLLVRVTSGLEHYSEQDIAQLKHSDVWLGRNDERGSWGDPRRIFVRKPQYEYGWDHVPRLATCGIVGNVWLEQANMVRYGAIHVATKALHDNSATLSFSVEIENLHAFRQADTLLSLAVKDANDVVFSLESSVLLQSGINHIEFECEIENPKLWWPNGTGEQNLYSAHALLSSREHTITAQPVRFGIRTISIDQSPLNQTERLFAIVVNGKKIYCKGADWVPADCIYARVTDEKYHTLLEEAANANFNMIRIWGGGIYEKDIFYDLCDRLGIMIWQDFMFSCAMYPDNLEWFRHEVIQEIEYQTKRLRNHASIALFCGNNENHWFFDKLWENVSGKFRGGQTCYNEIIPRIVKTNCPEIPYWRSSPYGGDDPNSGSEGDQHRWNDSFMNPDMAVRISPEEFDKTHAKFISEYGCTGPLTMQSTLNYHAGEPVIIGSSIWRQHINRFEKDATLPAIRKHYSDKPDLSLEEFLLYGSLFQGMMYAYSLESIRLDADCWGSLFWDYNDSWGEIGWSIIDYYCARKPSYYFVKRAFSCKKLIMREKAGIVQVMGVNDTPDVCDIQASYGYVSFDGKHANLQPQSFTLAPFSRKVVLEFDKGDVDLASGCVVAIPDQTGHGVLPALLRAKDFKQLSIPEASLAIRWLEQNGGCAEFEVTSDVFAHAVHFGLGADVRLSDEYFDLLPGETRRVCIENVPDGFSKSQVKLRSVR